MSFTRTLSRDEMKNVKAGGAEWTGCSSASQTFTAWRGECMNTYGGEPNKQLECVKQVNESQKFAVGMCGTRYR